MKSIQYYGPQNIKYEEVPVKSPKEGEVVVKVMSALTCGTDVKTFRRGHPVLIKSVPSGFGHEFAGVVDKVGKGVENVKEEQFRYPGPKPNTKETAILMIADAVIVSV